MQINLFNSLNPNGRRVPVTVVIEHIDVSTTNDGELIYTVSIHTGARDVGGNVIDVIYLNGVSEDSFQEELKKALTALGDQIDWGTLEADTFAPIITELIPNRDESSVAITSNLFITMKDPFPASFINLSTVKIKVNGIDVTPEAVVSEKNNRVSISWVPRRILT